jgi:hypothetical protein
VSFQKIIFNIFLKSLFPLAMMNEAYTAKSENPWMFMVEYLINTLNLPIMEKYNANFQTENREKDKIIASLRAELDSYKKPDNERNRNSSSDSALSTPSKSSAASTERRSVDTMASSSSDSQTSKKRKLSSDSHDDDIFKLSDSVSSLNDNRQFNSEISQCVLKTAPSTFESVIEDVSMDLDIQPLSSAIKDKSEDMELETEDIKPVISQESIETMPITEVSHAPVISQESIETMPITEVSHTPSKVKNIDNFEDGFEPDYEYDDIS